MLITVPSASAKTTIGKPKSSANPVVYGKTVLISGALRGSPSAGLAIKLQVSAFPYAAWVDAASAVTSTTGAYSFTLMPLVNTRYRIVTDAVPQEIGDELAQVVSQRVSLRVSDSTPKRRSSVRFYGSVWPANDGAYVEVQKLTSTGVFKTVTRVKLVDGGDALSRFSRKIRISKSGVYRVLATASPSLGEGASTTKSLRVH